MPPIMGRDMWTHNTRVAALALAIGAAPADGVQDPVRPEFPWGTDLTAATEQAEAQGKPLCVVFRCLR